MSAMLLIVIMLLAVSAGFLIVIALYLSDISKGLANIQSSIAAIARESLAKLEREKQNAADRERIHGDFLKREAENAYLKKLEES